MYIEFYINNEEYEEKLSDYKRIINKLYLKHFHKEIECYENWLALTDDGYKCYNITKSSKILEHWFNVPINADDFYKDLNNNETFIKDVQQAIPIINTKLADRERIWRNYYGD